MQVITNSAGGFSIRLTDAANVHHCGPERLTLQVPPHRRLYHDYTSSFAAV